MLYYYRVLLYLSRAFGEHSIGQSYKSFLILQINHVIFLHFLTTPALLPVILLNAISTFPRQYSSILSHTSVP